MITNQSNSRCLSPQFAFFELIFGGDHRITLFEVLVAFFMADCKNLSKAGKV